jgi:hypothetical protein
VNDELVPLIAGLAVCATIAWLLGWHYGAKSLRNRHKRLIKLMEENNSFIRERNKSLNNNWYDGYSAGVSSTLTAFEVFLEKFKE